MPRVLSAEERALWRRVTADMREAPRKAIAQGPVSPTRIAPPPRIVPTTAAHPPRPRTPAHRATLDGKWDRELKAGKVVPDRIIDLHGCTLVQAHDRAIDAIGAAVADGDRLIVLVTGKAPRAGTSRLDLPLRGIIRASISDWLHGAPFAGRIAAIRPAHLRHGGAGALYVILRRSDRP